jgi:two-component system, LuxR family, response regulator FixJ
MERPVQPKKRINLAMQRKPTIYIVGHEPQVLQSITLLVKPIGAKIRTFTRADKFLNSFHYEGPGCLVLDVFLPGMSGMELQMRLTQAKCQIPIIIIAGHADIRMAVDAMKAGAVNFLEKPFRPQELFEEIQKSLRTDIEVWKCSKEVQCLERKLAILKTGEREVLKLIQEGKTNKEIAQELQLSIRGVEARRAKAMKTLRIDSKTELMKFMRISSSCNSLTSSFQPNTLDNF